MILIFALSKGMCFVSDNVSKYTLLFNMKKFILLMLVSILFSGYSFSQSLPPNAILKNYRPFDSPRTNGRPGEVYRIDEVGRKFIVQDVDAIAEKLSEEGDLVGRMYFSSDELLTLLNLEFDRVEIIPCEVKILKAKREYNEQTSVDKELYENERIEELMVDPNSTYFIIRETILAKEVSFRFSKEIVKKIKRGASSLAEVKSSEEADFPFEAIKKFKKEKRIFYLDQQIFIDPYDL